MKLIKRLTLTLAFSSLIMTNVGCFGEFALTDSIREWNSEIGGDNLGGRFVENLVWIGLNIVPVYGIAGLADLIIFNLIEFWSGTNPLAMNSMQIEKQIVAYQGDKYEITATKNKFHIMPLTGKQEGTPVELVYQPTQKKWVMIKNSVPTEVPTYTSSKFGASLEQGS